MDDTRKARNYGMEKHRLILDCDTKNEIDDQFAIAYALLSPDIAVEGVVSVQNQGNHGEASVDLYHREARKVLRLAGADVPAFKGSRHPVSARGTPERSEGVTFIIDSVRAHGSAVTIVATGPASDLANACLIAPDVMRRAKILWIGGFRDNAEMRRVKSRECNFINDPRAVGLLCSLDLDFTILPAMGVTDAMMVQAVRFAELLRERNTPLTSYLARLLETCGNRYRILWDIAAVAAAKGLGVERVVRKPACTVRGNRLIYPARSDHTVRVIDAIDELAMLADARYRLLSERQSEDRATHCHPEHRRRETKCVA
ncbi:MAG: hypothetical protein GF331_00880 [Chitinivibrionales bacterium]|nr:hypothetical protein [Chitinivibrionales bacterium]